MNSSSLVCEIKIQFFFNNNPWIKINQMNGRLGEKEMLEFSVSSLFYSNQVTNLHIYISDDDDDDDVIHVNIKWTNACALNIYMFLN